jgi:hypothetical protein
MFLDEAGLVFPCTRFFCFCGLTKGSDKPYYQPVIFSH